MSRILLMVFMVLLLLAVEAPAEVRVSIPSGEKVSGEKYDVTVRIPFDEDYQISLSNKDERRRALVKIRIDGRTVTNDGLILRAGENVSLERFLDTGSLTSGKRFRFVEKDEDVRKGRIDRTEDGVIIVTVQYEKDQTPGVEYGDYLPRWGSLSTYPYANAIPTSVTNTSSLVMTSATSVVGASLPGITVEGGESRQRFQQEDVKDLDDRTDTAVVRLVGFYRNPPILLKR